MERLRVTPEVRQIPGESLQYASRHTREFLMRAFEEGLHLVLPENHVALLYWQRDLNILLTYYGTQLSMHDVGELFKIRARNKQRRVGKILKRTIRRLHKNSSKRLQRNYPFDEIKISKPTTELMRKRMSKAKGGKRIDSTAYGLIIQRTRRIRAELEIAETDEELRKALANVDHSFLKNNPKLFISIYRIARNCGFMFSTRSLEKFLRVLRERRIPFGHVAQELKGGKHKGEIHNYYFTLKRQEERIRKVFAEDRAAR